jgi:hypothetical protein
MLKPHLWTRYGAYYLSMTTMRLDCIYPETGDDPAAADVILRQAPDEEEDEEEDEDDRKKENDDDDDTTHDGYSE